MYKLPLEQELERVCIANGIVLGEREYPLSILLGVQIDDTVRPVSTLDYQVRKAVKLGHEQDVLFNLFGLDLTFDQTQAVDGWLPLIRRRSPVLRNGLSFTYNIHKDNETKCLTPQELDDLVEKDNSAYEAIYVFKDGDPIDDICVFKEGVINTSLDDETLFRELQGQHYNPNLHSKMICKLLMKFLRK